MELMSALRNENLNLKVTPAFPDRSVQTHGKEEYLKATAPFLSSYAGDSVPPHPASDRKRHNLQDFDIPYSF